MTPNGGDGRLDIYVLPGTIIDADITVAVGTGQQRPCYIILYTSPLYIAYLTEELAHELFHAFQNAFDCEESKWFKESTAVWASIFIDPGSPFNHNNLPSFFDKVPHYMKQLNTEKPADLYGTYFFPYFLSKIYIGDDSIIPSLWTSCKEMDGLSLDAVKAGLQDFDHCFMEFALTNSGVGKYSNTYKIKYNLLELHETHQVYVSHELEKDDMLLEGYRSKR